MKMGILVLIAGLAITACNKERSLDPLPTNDASTLKAEKAMVTRPMKVNFYATPDLTKPPVECLPAGSAIFVGGGMIIRGTATHLGQLNPANSFGNVTSCNLGPMPYELTTQHTGQVAAANGDLMYYTSSEVINATTGAMTGVVTLAGGTGRFLNATGSLNFVGSVNFQTGNSQWSGTGTVTF